MAHGNSPTMRHRIRFALLAPLFLFSSLMGLSSVADDSGPFNPLTFQNGIVFRHPENAFEVNLRFRIQNLLQYNTVDIDDFRAESLNAQVRRLRLRTGGWVFSPQFRYNLQLSFSRSDMDWDNTAFPHIVRDAVVIWEPFKGWQLAFGQSKLPGNRQRVVSSGEMQFIDRSIVNRTFNIDRDFGFQTRYGGLLGPVGFSVLGALSAGEGRNSPSSDSGLSYTLRGEILPLGEFTANGDYFEGDLSHEPDLRISLGGGVNFNSRARRTGGTIGVAMTSGSRDMTTTFADLMAKWRGVSLYLEYMGRTSPDPLVTTASGSDAIYVGHGFNAQTGYHFLENWEVVTRYSGTWADTAIQAVKDTIHQGTLGVNYYIRGHRMKVQTDVSYQLATRLLPTVRNEPNWIGRFQVELGI